MIHTAIVSWLIALIFFSLMLRRFARQGRITAVVVLIVLGIQVFFRPVLFFFELDTPFPYSHFSEYEWDLLSTAMLVTLLWLMVFKISYIGSYSAVRPLSGFLPRVNNFKSANFMSFTVLGATAASVLITAQFVLQSGSISQFMYDVKVGKEFAGLYVFRQICIIAALFAGFCVVYAGKLKQEDKSKAAKLLFTLSLFALFINFATLYTWANRHYMTMIAIGTLIGWSFYVARISFLKLAIIGFIAVFLLLELKDLRADNFAAARGSEVIRNYSFWLDISTSLHFNQLDAFMLALRDAGNLFDFRNGRDFYNGLISWIPRSILPEREAHNVGAWFRQVYQPTVVNGWPITVMGSWYVNFGVFGILLGSAVSGIVCAIFDNAFRNPFASAWNAVIGAGIALLMFDGGVNTGFVQGFFLVIIPLHILAWLIRRKKPSAHVVFDKRNLRFEKGYDNRSDLRWTSPSLRPMNSQGDWQ